MLLDYLVRIHRKLSGECFGPNLSLLRGMMRFQKPNISNSSIFSQGIGNKGVG